LETPLPVVSPLVQRDTSLLQPTKHLQSIEGGAEHAMRPVTQWLRSRHPALHEYPINHEAVHLGVAGDHPLLHVERLHAAGPKPDSTSKSGAFRPVKQFSASRLAGRHSPSRQQPAH